MPCSDLGGASQPPGNEIPPPDPLAATPGCCGKHSDPEQDWHKQTHAKTKTQEVQASTHTDTQRMNV